MKMIFHGGQRRLMPIWATWDNMLLKQYWKEVRDGLIKYGFTDDKTLFIETSIPELMREMNADFSGIKGRVKRMQLHVAGIKVEMIE